MRGKLILENGLEFEGSIFGYTDEIAYGEVVFNTGMVGYQEILTDPSYFGQIVTMTYPLIGNYGINSDDMESEKAKVKGFVVRENTKRPSNFRHEFDLDSYLKSNHIVGIEDIDTRALTQIIRENGVMKGAIVPDGKALNIIEFGKIENVIKESVQAVSTKKTYTIFGKGIHVGVLDFGIKKSIIDEFKKRDCKITVFPYNTGANEIQDAKLDFIFLSNGPGNPEDLNESIENIKELIGKIPVVGICLGHQLLALSLGGKTAKLKYGHRGCNHPVKNLMTNRIIVTSQNHGFYVDKLPPNTEVIYVSLNDNTIEGMKSEMYGIYSVQFHPEAGPGPWDAKSIFDDFLEFVTINNGGALYAN